ncbi:CRISPR-associated protein Cas5 [Gloeocapsa sp. PCC 73106]|uniref:CRISPR-associated protein Cas5 n=1 Tax=Gloeocapsa sp. PCC 73106 TaxID=102232 RepID=UPI0002ACDA6B|nr:CRISPR-associated protein Cas5 [Gloeocapsa sp. PCC 73106]ELR97561.1 CRISPR-associated protein Cas5 [Gloeocapsa sp. PCC 73106]
MNDFLYLECPCTSFPRSFARDYKETYLYPPPSTIYGFLLSLVGEEDLTAHLGVKIALGMIGETPPISRIVRKQRHHKFSKTHQGIYPPSQFSIPNFQELLTDLKIVIKLESDAELAKITLAQRVAIALSNPSEIKRFGGLSLGESWALINGLRKYRPEDGKVSWLIRDNRGLIGLPVWINRETTQGIFQRFRLTESEAFEDNCWIEIKAPVVEKKTQSRSKTKRSPKATN